MPRGASTQTRSAAYEPAGPQHLLGHQVDRGGEPLPAREDLVHVRHRRLEGGSHSHGERGLAGAAASVDRHHHDIAAPGLRRPREVHDGGHRRGVGWFGTVGPHDGQG